MESKDIGSLGPVWPVTPAKRPGPRRRAPAPGETGEERDSEERDSGEDNEHHVDAFA